MREFYEDLWERLPTELQPPEFERRAALLRSELRRGERVLDLGCGAGHFSAVAAAAGAGSVVAADVAEHALRRVEPRSNTTTVLVPFDGPLPFADEEFDLVWASEVIEHVADTALWMREVRRVLKPGGRLLLTTPAHGRLRLLLGGIERYSEPQGDHLHLYTRRSLRELLDGYGFAEVATGALSGPPLMRRTLLARAELAPRMLSAS